MLIVYGSVRSIQKDERYLCHNDTIHTWACVVLVHHSMELLIWMKQNLMVLYMYFHCSLL